MNVRFGTRGSKLALWQTHHVMHLVRQASPDVEIEEIIVKTLGDKVTDRPLFKVGGQGLFIKEIEEALIAEKIDIAIHSLKDVPHSLGEGLTLAAISEREDPRDALLTRSGKPLTGLPKNAVIGTSSLRRQAQLRVLRPDLKFTDLRGNLDTRLRKLETGEMDAIVLAAAGLRRLGFADRITELFSLDTMIPAAGQGLLGIECREADLKEFKPLLKNIENKTGRVVATAERAFLRHLQGGCQVPLAVHAVMEGNIVVVRAFLADPHGKKLIRSTVRGKPSEADQLGIQAAEELLTGGAKKLLQEWRTATSGKE